MSQFRTFDTTQIRLYLSIFTPYRQNSGIVTSPKRYEFLKFNLHTGQNEIYINFNSERVAAVWEFSKGY